MKTEAKKLKSQGVNIIIGLGHAGYENDKELARYVPDIDLVIGGHTHTFLYTGMCIKIYYFPFLKYFFRSKFAYEVCKI